jgi:hypothetical protein
MDHLVLRHPSYMRGFTNPFYLSVTATCGYPIYPSSHLHSVMGPFVMGPFAMGPFVMGPLVMGPNVGVPKLLFKEN